uniref:Dynein heavy chain tail domain-containing protein n=1 Tax=Rhodnius prolixus TaxID=13249 RepID=T1HUN6_RHOPR
MNIFVKSLKQIGCFMINLDNLRSTIESQNRRYWSGLTIWLRTSLKKDIVTIQNFLDRAYTTIDQPPLCVEDINESHFNHRLLSEETFEVSKLINEVDTKNQLLRTWTKETVPDVPHIMSLWDNFQIVMSNFHIVVSRQEESLKDRLSSTAEEMITEMERFVLRWNELKPNEDKLTEIQITDRYIADSLELVNNTRQQWEIILQKISKLRVFSIRLQ